jgi:hypothetical protein
MRLLLIPMMFCTLGADASSAQTIPAPSTLTTLRLLPTAQLPGGISPHRQSPSDRRSKQQKYDGAVGDCMQMWDSGTHMTKQAWARTCKRVQSRLDNLKVDWLMPERRQVR